MSYVRGILPLFATLALAVPAPGKVQAPDKLVKSAEAELRQHGDVEKLTAAPALADVARLYYFLGSWNEDEAALPFFEKGKEAADRARRADPAHSAAVFWWAGNIGSIARIKKNIGALKVIKDIEVALRAGRDRDPSFGYDAWDRMLGTMYHEAPSFISIGDNDRAAECLRRAAQKFPDYPGNSLSLAKYLQAQGEGAEALRLAAAAEKNLARDFKEFRYERPQWEAWIAEVRK